MSCCLWIPGKLPGLNDMLYAAPRERARIKRTYEEAIALRAVQQSFVAPGLSLQFHYLFVEPDRRRDPINVAASGIKMAEDAMVRTQRIFGDDQAVIRGIHFWVRSETETQLPPGVFVMVANEELSEPEILDNAREHYARFDFTAAERNQEAKRARRRRAPSNGSPLARAIKAQVASSKKKGRRLAPAEGDRRGRRGP